MERSFEKWRGDCRNHVPAFTRHRSDVRNSCASSHGHRATLIEQQRLWNEAGGLFVRTQRSRIAYERRLIFPRGPGSNPSPEAKEVLVFRSMV
jgi:hypothetical protein